MHRARALAEDDPFKRFEIHDLSKHGGPQPKLLHLGAVAPDILCVRVREFFGVRGRFGPYVPEPGDEIVVEKGKNRALKRRGKKIGYIGGPRGNLHLVTDDSRTGKPLQLRYATDPSNYALRAGRTPVQIRDVHLKSRPVDNTKNGYCREHSLFLELAGTLAAGADCTLDFGRVNLDRAKARFTFDARRLRSEAIHVSQVGFRADDPAKLGFLSMWMGTGGGCDAHREGMPFELVAEGGQRAVYRGRTRLRSRRTQTAHGLHAKGRNYELADTYLCEFSDFSRPGRYVLSVEGVGCSYPFTIGRSVWGDAFATSMRGFFHQRSGQEWREPWAAWRRPRDLHPADGAHNTVFELSISELEFSTVLGDGKLEKLLEHRTDKTLQNAWGGYHDAGDYDRRQSHMVASRRMMELLELFPRHYRGLELQIPERANRIPDILDEALWCPSLYRRMRREDGAVRGGIETNGHPRRGEPSHLDTLTKMAFAPDVRASWTYAATAAQAAHLLAREGEGRSASEWRSSAVRAAEWAESEYAANAATLHRIKGWWRLKDARNLAAVHLFRLTGEKRWHVIFRETCGYAGRDRPSVFRWGSHVQSEAAMTYARLPREAGDPALKRRASQALVAHAESQIDYASKQAYMFTADDTGAPHILGSHSAPKGLDLCRAHYLTKKERFLEWAIKSTLFSVGANPMNMVMTTGLGSRSATYPLYLDMKYMGRDSPPPGITVYGIHDPVFFKTSWAYTWILNHRDNCFPNYKQWPLSEFFFDTYAWPLANEFTVQQTMAPAAYVWGYLAARD
jgi:endoglucanase